MLLSPAPILKHLGLRKQQNENKPTCLTKLQQEPYTSVKTTSLSQPKSPSASNINNKAKERASPSTLDSSSMSKLISEDEASQFNKLSEVNNNKDMGKVHRERSPAVVESNGLLEDCLCPMENGISDQNDCSLLSSFGKRKPLLQSRRLKPASADFQHLPVARGSKHKDYSLGRELSTPLGSFDVCDYKSDNSIMERIAMHRPFI